ncbi:MAG: UDP-N-acetylglucosamine 2-epimerase (hydrolyzing) [Rhizobiaceae bacterium]|nr:UDP-N-acetylglucosamine 2-epimerase (hydrolyzing) [Rhizobiaceae bacterium]
MTDKRRIAVVLNDRANYGRLQPVMAAIKAHPDLELITLCGGTMVLDRFDRPLDVVREDGFSIDSEIYLELEGSTPLTMAKSVGFGVVEYTSELARLDPDVVLIIGDRYESFAAAIAASYLNMVIAHIQGGEVSGSIDESARHCITKLAQYHFPSTARAAEYIIRMGERADTVFNFGCPSGDIVKSLDLTVGPELFRDGVGAPIDPSKPYALVLFHPVTTKLATKAEATEELLGATAQLGMQTVWLWPNIDAGSDHVSGAIRRYREQHDPSWLRLMKNFAPEDYLRVLSNATVALGNSSSFVRDSSFLGTPVVLIGDRQQARETAENVTRTVCVEAEILKTARAQLAHGHYPASTLYGKGDASEQIADKLSEVELYIQKRLDYVDQPA